MPTSSTISTSRALKAEIPVDDLSAYEKPVFDDMHDQAMHNAALDETRAHEHRLNSFREAGVDADALGD